LGRVNPSTQVLRFAPPGSAEEMEKATVLAGMPNTWGRSAHQLAFPSCAILDADGSLLVADTNNHRIQRFEPNSQEATTLAGSSSCKKGDALHELDMPTGICRDPRDGTLLVTDRGNARVLRFPAKSKAGCEGTVVAGPDLVSRPWGICAAPDGAIFVSDDRDAVVLKIEADGVPVAPRPLASEPPLPVHPSPDLDASDVVVVEEEALPKTAAEEPVIQDADPEIELVISGSPDELD